MAGPSARCKAWHMAHQLTIDQLREIVHLRRRHPSAEVLVHHKPWGIILEARCSGRAIELECIDRTGAVTPELPIACVLTA